jgi:hypothetical protein
MPKSSSGSWAYRAHAAKCVYLAQRTDDPDSKRELLEMARAWLVLAEQADKSGEGTPVYETPEPRHDVAQQQQQPQPKKSE